MICKTVIDTASLHIHIAACFPAGNCHRSVSTGCAIDTHVVSFFLRLMFSTRSVASDAATL